MLKRTQILLGLTIAASIVASLFLVGCGGHSSTMPSVSGGSNEPSRGWRDATVTLVSASSPAVVKVTDPDGIVSITVRDSNGGRAYYFPKGAKEFQFQLANFGQVAWHVVGIVDGRLGGDSTWIIFPDGRVVLR